MSMLAALKGAEKQAPTNIVNTDIKVVENIDGKDVVIRDTTPQGPLVRTKFKPIDEAVRAAFDAEAIAENEKMARAAPSNNFDLVGDDIGASPQQKARAVNAGRPRLYPSSAARQRAYRERQKTSA